MTAFLSPQSQSQLNLDSSWLSTEDVTYVPLSHSPTASSMPPAPQARTIVCEGKLSIRTTQGTVVPGELPPPVPNLRRRSLDILRNAFASVLPNKDNKEAAPPVTVRGGKEKWVSVHAWLDDAALLHLEGFASPGASMSPTVRIERSTTKWGRKSIDWSKGRKSAEHAVTVKVTRAQPRKSLDVWNRRSWSVEAESWNYEEAMPRRPSHPQILFNPINAARQSAPHTSFRVLSLDRDPSGTILLLHVEPYDVNSVTTADPEISPLSPNAQLTTLYLRFKSVAKLDRWRAAFSLALCVAEARAEAEAVQEVERKFVEAEEARRAAEVEKDKVEKKLKKEKKEWERKVKGMFSAEEVQDVYQETADQLAEAEKKITALEEKLTEEIQSKVALRRELEDLRAETEGPLGEYNALVLRHEELLRKYEEAMRENVLVKALYEKELNAHKRLAGLLRKQAADNVEAAETFAQAQAQGLLSPTLTPTPSVSPVPSLDMSRRGSIDMSRRGSIDAGTRVSFEGERRISLDTSRSSWDSGRRMSVDGRRSFDGRR